MAAAFSVPLLLATAAAPARPEAGSSGGAATPRGRQGSPRRAIPLAGGRYPALLACAAVSACAVFLPYGILARAAFSRAVGRSRSPGRTSRSTTGPSRSSTPPRSRPSSTRSSSAILTAVRGRRLAALLAYIANLKIIPRPPGAGRFSRWRRSSSRCRPRRRPLRRLHAAPFVLYGTLWILFLALISPRRWPVGYSQSDATFRGIHPELEEAGRILGAGRLRVLGGGSRAPLARSGIIATWCFVFIGVIRRALGIDSSCSRRHKVISVVIFDLKEEGQFGAIRRPRPVHARP